ncbi:MAG: hypothetical protein IJU61_06010 [Victivallales bacterium]|nr:hypothetical protein [Victivallales bacterium]
MSNENKPSYTPGPWKITDWDDECTCTGVSVSDSKGNMLCDFDECHHFDREECRANAMLIKEAPAMRSVLAKLLRWDRCFAIDAPKGLLVLDEILKKAQKIINATRIENGNNN